MSRMGRIFVPGRGMNNDDPRPVPLLASRSLAAGASACTPCGAGSYYGSTGVRAFARAGARARAKSKAGQVERWGWLGREIASEIGGEG